MNLNVAFEKLCVAKICDTDVWPQFGR